MGMKLSDTMIAVLVKSLDRKRENGRYWLTETPQRTRDALITRGLAEVVQEVIRTNNATGIKATTPYVYLTEAGVTEARKQQQATADLQRVVNEEAAKPAVSPVEGTRYRMFVGILREDAKDMGELAAANVREAIKNANGHPVEQLAGGVIRVGYSFFEPMAQEAVSAPVSVQEQREGLPVGEAFVRAVETARHAIPVMQSVVKPEAWCAHVIVRRAGAVEAYSVYPASAWEQPAEVPFLPWSPPVGERVAVVALDGSVSAYEGDPVARACEECDAAPGEPCSPLFTCGAQVAQDAEDVRAQQQEEQRRGEGDPARHALGLAEHLVTSHGYEYSELGGMHNWPIEGQRAFHEDAHALDSAEGRPGRVEHVHAAPVPVGFAHVGAFIAGRDA